VVGEKKKGRRAKQIDRDGRASFLRSSEGEKILSPLILSDEEKERMGEHPQSLPLRRGGEKYRPSKS